MPVTATANINEGKVTVAIALTGTVTKVQVGRMDPSGFVELIRYGDLVDTPGGALTLDDFEVPLDTSVYYVVTEKVPVGPTTASNKVTLASNGYSWLKDPGYPSMNVKIPVVTSLQTLTRASRTGVFNILDRVNPIVVSAKRQGPTAELIVHTLSNAQRIAMRDLVARGTTLLLQTPPAYGFGSEYIAISDVDEVRVGLASEQSRRWNLPFIVVDRPEGLSSAPTIANRWADVKATYATWADLKATGKTWDQLLQNGVA
jgi:hypothetical protein